MTNNQFALNVNNRVLYFDTDGEVWDAQNQAGRWSTNAQNEIVFTATDGSSVRLPVRWRFDSGNYLLLYQGDTPVHQFGGETPLAKFTVRDNVLYVDPDINDQNDFTFGLQVKWGLMSDGRLKLTISGEVSCLNGWLQSNDSGFEYRFVQLDPGATPYTWVLQLSGQWKQVESADTARQIVLRFELKDPALEDSQAPLKLPAPVGVNSRNNLEFRFTGNGQSHRIEFQGTLKIAPGTTAWELTFNIQSSKDGKSRKTVVTVGANVLFDSGSSVNLVFYVGRTWTPGAQALSIGGDVRFKLSAKSGLDVAFAYNKSGKAATLVAGGRFYLENNEVVLKYKRNGKDWSIAVSAQVKLEKVDITIGAELINGPKDRRVTAFLGIRF